MESDVTICTAGMYHGVSTLHWNCRRDVTCFVLKLEVGYRMSLKRFL